MALVMALSTACNNENSSEHKNHSNPEADLNEINDVVSELIEKCQDFAPNDVTKGLPGEWASVMSSLPYTEYSLEGTSCEWNFPYDFDEIVDAVIVNSDEELSKYIKSENNASYPDIDFTKQSLVITYGSQNSGIESIHLVDFEKVSEAYYELLIEITPNLACVMSPWTYAFITEKLSDQTQIKLGVILKQE